ncbi:MAG: hypothetical protein U0939_05950 [Pirellulales bacterium]
MIRQLMLFLLVFLAGSSPFGGSSRADEPKPNAAKPSEPQLKEPLAALKPFVGKTWRGEFKQSTPEKPQFDVSRWEAALKGHAVRIRHSVNNGVYGGESLVMWNAEKKQMESFYFTNAGFYTQAVITVADGKMTSREKVVGNQQGITEVEAVSQVLPDGRLHVKSRYLKGTEWVDGHEIMYSEAPDAEVKID